MVILLQDNNSDDSIHKVNCIPINQNHEPPGNITNIIYSQFHDNIYIQVYTCANGSIGTCIYLYEYVVMKLGSIGTCIYLYVYVVMKLGSIGTCMYLYVYVVMKLGSIGTCIYLYVYVVMKLGSIGTCIYLYVYVVMKF